jgi:hypothetical protein
MIKIQPGARELPDGDEIGIGNAADVVSPEREQSAGAAGSCNEFHLDAVRLVDSVAPSGLLIRRALAQGSRPGLAICRAFGAECHTDSDCGRLNGDGRRRCSSHL